MFLTFQHVFPDYRNRCCFWCPRCRDLRFIKLLIIIYDYSRAPFLFLRSALLLHIASDFTVEVGIPEAAHQLHSFCCLSVDSRHAMGRDGLHYIAHYSIPANSWRAGVSRAALGITAALKTRLLNLSSQISPWHPNTKKIRERDRAVFSDTTVAELEPEKAGGGGWGDGKI